MLEHIHRLRIEAENNYTRLTKLSTFIRDSPVYPTLDPQVQILLARQEEVMTDLQDILDERILYATSN